MPENRVEWRIFGLGLVLLALLGVVIGLNVGDDPARGARAAAAGRPAREAEPAPPVATTTRTVPTRPTARPVPKPKPDPKPARQVQERGVRLRLGAARGDSWLEVRSGSAAFRLDHYG